MNLKATEVLETLKDTKNLCEQLTQREPLIDNRGRDYSGYIQWDIELYEAYEHDTMKQKPAVLKKILKCTKPLDETSEGSMLRFLEIGKQLDAWLAGEGEYPVAKEKAS